MEKNIIIVAILAVRRKVLDRLGTLVAEELDMNVTGCSVHDRAAWQAGSSRGSRLALGMLGTLRKNITRSFGTANTMSLTVTVKCRHVIW